MPAVFISAKFSNFQIAVRNIFSDNLGSRVICLLGVLFAASFLYDITDLHRGL